jgi:hypothetical protein
MRISSGARIGVFGVLFGLAGAFSAAVFPSPLQAATKTTKPPTLVSIGTQCTAGTGVDATGKRAACKRIKEVGNVWVWSDPVPSPVTDTSVPTSWASVTVDNTGWNDPQAAGLTATYPNRTAIEQSFIAMVNRWRAERNLAALTHDPRLDRLSKNWAERYTRPEYQGITSSAPPATSRFSPATTPTSALRFTSNASMGPAVRRRQCWWRNSAKPADDAHQLGPIDGCIDDRSNSFHVRKIKHREVIPRARERSHRPRRQAFPAEVRPLDGVTHLGTDQHHINS